MDMSALKPNEKKSLEIETSGGTYQRYPVKTHVVMAGDSLTEIMDRYVKPYLEQEDMIFISEKIIAISQGRAFDIDEIKVSPLANFLCKFVYKSPYGIGLGSPWTMELAIRDIGVPKILLAAFCSAVTKPFGKRGVFYKIVGDAGRAIDGPCDYTLPPYNTMQSLRQRTRIRSRPCCGNIRVARRLLLWMQTISAVKSSEFPLQRWILSCVRKFLKIIRSARHLSKRQLRLCVRFLRLKQNMNS